MERGEAPGRGQAGYCGCWSLVPSAQGWFPEWRPVGGPRDTCWQSWGGGEVPNWGRPAPPRTSPANHRACAPTPSKTAKGTLSRPPHHKHSLLGGGAWQTHT